VSHVTAATVQGARARQEDCWVIAPVSAKQFSGHLLAIFDGHGGPQVAEQARALLAPVFLKAFAEEAGPSRALRAAVAALSEATKNETPGSTASVALVNESSLTVAVLGDSPVAWLDANQEFHSAALHNARSNLEERQKAVGRGAVYTDGYLEDPLDPGWQLQMSRALGDASLRRILDRSPDLYEGTSGPVLLLASDGLLSPSAPVESQMRGFIDEVLKGATAATLVEDAVRRRTGDNATVILWRATV
jgi:serine/threonine protein phosphatase PrpC